MKTNFTLSIKGFLMISMIFSCFYGWSQTQTFTSSGTFTVPAGATSITVECWGGGGGGGNTLHNGNGTSRGGGGAGGAYAKKVISSPSGTYTVTVGNGGTGSNIGEDSWFGTVSTVIAKGGAAGNDGSKTNGTGGAGTATGSIGDVGGVFAGGNGGNSTNANGSGGGGGGAGSTAIGKNATNNVAGGTTSNNGGAGGAGITGSGLVNGNSGSNYGAGGSGSISIGNPGTARTGGSGANGLVTVTYSCSSYSLSSTNVSNVCTSNTATVNLTSSAANLPAGTYTVTYDLSGANTATGNTASMTVTTAGIGNFLTTSLSNAGITNVIVTNLKSGSGVGCSNAIISNNSASFNVISSNTVGSASSTPTLCINTVLTNITHTTTTATGIGTPTNLPSGVTAAWASNTITISGTPTVSGNFNYSIPLTGGCGGVVNATGTITVTPNNTASAASSSPSSCINAVLTNITHTTTGATGIGSPTGLPSGVTAAWSANTITISGTPTASGTFNYTIPLTGGCGSVNATGTIIVYSDFTAGAIETAGETVCYNGNPTLGIGSSTNASGGDESIMYVWQANGVDIPGSNSETFDPPPGLTVTTTYTRFAKDNTCNTTFTQSTGSWVVTISTANTWTGATSTDWATATNWSCGVAPASVSDVTISTASNYPEISSDVAINSLTLDSGTTLKVNTSNSLTVTDVVDNDGQVTLENNAYLLQTNNVANTGSGTTIVKCNSSAIMRLDYTLWSSPVTGQELYDFSKFTFPNRFYKYLTATDVYSNSVGFSISGLDGNGVNGSDDNDVPFDTAKGYLIRTPWNHPTAPAVWTGEFEGVPNNGNIGYTLETTGDSYNAVGNPYPSPISIETFLDDNSSLIESTLWFWRKTNNPNNSITPTTSYITYSGGTYSSGNETNYNIQPGQGFFVQATTSGSLQFNNLQRVTSDGRFFRNNTQTNTVGEGRVWLNLKRGTELAGSLAIGYKDGATNDLDANFDGKYINDSSLALTSFIQGEELAVQHRATPFVDTDVVPLSFKTNLAGTFSINFNGADGVLDTQDVYLLDLLSNQSVDIKSAPYSFTSESGVFENRFKIVYVANALGIESPTFNANQVVIYQNEANSFGINTGNIVMSSVKVFDIRGRLLINLEGINASQTTVTAGQTNEVLLVQITSQDGLVVTKKVIR